MNNIASVKVSTNGHPAWVIYDMNFRQSVAGTGINQWLAPDFMTGKIMASQPMQPRRFIRKLQFAVASDLFRLLASVVSE